MGGIFFFVYILLGAIPLLLYGSVPGPMSLLADVGYILAGGFMLINKKNIVACIGFGILALQGFLQFVNGILQFTYYVNPLSAMFFKLLGFAGYMLLFLCAVIQFTDFMPELKKIAAMLWFVPIVFLGLAALHTIASLIPILFAGGLAPAFISILRNVVRLAGLACAGWWIGITETSGKRPEF